MSYGNYNYIPFINSGNPAAITDGNGIIIDDQKHAQDFQDNALKNHVYKGQTLIENNICFGNGGRGILIDYKGADRPMGKSVDIGAYERE